MILTPMQCKEGEQQKYELKYWVGSLTFTKVVDDDYARMIIRAIEWGKKEQQKETRELLEKIVGPL